MAKKAKLQTARGRSILKGLTEFREYLEGNRKLWVYHYDVPDPIDVRAIRERSGLGQGEFARRNPTAVRRALAQRVK
jgi:DNA-binding transcriptional regulator YiaG